MIYSFDDRCFGLSKDNNKVDHRIVDRPAKLTRAEWYAFAGTLATELNRIAQPR